MTSRHARNAVVLAITALFVAILTVVYPYSIQGENSSTAGDSQGTPTAGALSGELDRAVADRLSEAVLLSQNQDFARAGESCFEILRDYPDGRADLLAGARREKLHKPKRKKRA